MSIPQVLADAILCLHLGVVVFVVGGLFIVPIGSARGWRWARDGWFRYAHIIAMSSSSSRPGRGAGCLHLVAFSAAPPSQAMTRRGRVRRGHAWLSSCATSK